MIQGILDTNIITALFKENQNCIQKYDEYLSRFGTIHLSLIVYYEVYRGLLYLGSKKILESFEDFIQNCTLLEISQSVMDRAAEIYVALQKKGQLIQDADILIAATALVNGIGVITDNVEHFSRIEEVAVENWLL